jgi:uncharacterized membrane protein
VTKNRLEAFSDGVIAIIITIMVLELQAPAGHTFAALLPLSHKFMAYVLSFAFVGIYWNNHHHLLHAVKHVDGRVLWANIHLLFWLSLIPFSTDWAGEHWRATAPAAFYGGILLMSGVAYYALTRALIACHADNAALARAVGEDRKGKISVALYALAVPLAFAEPGVSWLIYVGVAGLWLVPDQRIEKAVTGH